jgi:putative tryptophan/tyrosine transport system substrate-binding protein
VTAKMKRREFISLLGRAAVAWPLAAHAQQGERIRKVGILVPGTPATPQLQGWIAAFRDGLQKIGWVDGRNVVIVERWAVGPEGLVAAAAELIGLAPDVVLTATASATRPMLAATRTLSIVFANVPDPVDNGFVTSLARPAGNITGFANYEPAIAIKWLELLKQIAPGVARVGVIYDPANPTVAAYLRALEAAAPSFGVQVLGTAVHDAEGIERAIAVFGAQPNGGLIVPSGPATVNHLERLIALATAKALPSVHPTREAVLAGALASYGVDTGELFRSAAFYVDRILKGEQPGDLPIQFATKFELIINLKTARRSAWTRQSNCSPEPTR